MKDTKRILVPVDFSECSSAALGYALTLAEYLDAMVDVLHTWQMPAYVAPYTAVHLAGSKDAPERLEVIAFRQAFDEMRSFLDKAEIPNGVKVGARVELGLEAQSIVMSASNYDLVVMGTHGRTGLWHMFMGSIAEKVVRASPVPVVTVRAIETTPVLPKKLLIPVDLTPGAKETVLAGYELAKTFGATADVLHVWSLPPHLPLVELQTDGRWTAATLEKSTAAAASAALDEFLADIPTPEGVEVNTWVQQGEPAPVINESAVSYDLVVQATHGRSGVSRMMLGSVATKVVRGSLAPVYSIRMSEAAIEAEDEGTDIEEDTAPHVVHALFENAGKLDDAYRALIDAGVPMRDISLVMNEETYKETTPITERTHVADGATSGTVIGGAVGGIVGLLSILGSGLAASAALLTIGPALAIAAAGGLVGGLVGWGVDSDEAKRIHAAIDAGSGFIAVHAVTEEEADQASEVLIAAGGERLN